MFLCMMELKSNLHFYNYSCECSVTVVAVVSSGNIVVEVVFHFYPIFCRGGRGVVSCNFTPEFVAPLGGCFTIAL